MANRSELPKETGENLNSAITKREVFNVDGVSISQTSVNQPSEIIKFRPKNSTLNNAEWILAVSQWGLEGAMARLFKEWRYEHPVAQKEQMYFGRLAQESEARHPGKKIRLLR